MLQLASTRRRALAWTLALLACPLTAGAQEFRATITGRVTDSGGLAVPGVAIAVTNTQTAEVTTVTANQDGAYTVPFLRPGIYEVRVTLEGFRAYVREGLQLELGQTATVNIVLEVGALTETITIAAADAMDASKADRGLVIDNKRVTEIPLNSRNPFMLSTLSPGITFNGPAIYQRPFDNGAIADWSINGGQNRNNEFLLDGAPNNSIQGGNNIAYVPPVDSVQEFKIITNGYDAQYGRSAGGAINVSLKSGTNDFHGTVYEFYRRKWLDANYYQFERRGDEKPDHKLDQYGFEVDGPIVKNKTFFMFNYEGYKESTPNIATLDAPREDLLTGDFSNYRNANGDLITIYDPLTGRLENGQWVRDPFPGNRIPQERINPVSRQLSQYFLRPNQAPTAGSANWQNNYYFAPNLARDDFHNYATKIDHNFSDKTRMFGRYGQNKRTEIRYVNGIQSGPAQDGQLPLERINYTGVVDWTRTIGNSLVIDIRSGLNQYIEAARTDAGLGFNAAELGFSPDLAEQLPRPMFPRIEVGGLTALGRGSFSRETTTVFSVQPNFSWQRGKHSVRGGLDARLTWYTPESSENAGMMLRFNDNFTRRSFDQGDSLSGSGLASFLLGYTTEGWVDDRLFPKFRWNYYAPWFQDDWQINNRLTVNLGLRWDVNMPVYELENRLNAGFDTASVNPVSDRIDQVLFPGYQVRGGLRFIGGPGSSSRYPYDADYNNLQPRAGVSFMLNDRTVIKGGYGLYFMNPTGTTTTNGYSIRTPYVTSEDGGRTPATSLSNPFPDGVATPPGAGLGLETYLGRDPSFSNSDFVIPYVHQFSVGIQRMLPWRTSVDVFYVGSRTRKQQSQFDGFNEPSLELRNRCDASIGGDPSYCNELVPNPFFGVAGFEGTSRFTSATLSRWELSRPFPQFGRFSQYELNEGQIWYDSLQLVANKRFSDGITLTGTYTLSKMTEEWGFLDEQQRIEQKGPYWSDRPHRVTLSGVYELPFGAGRRFLGNATGVVNGLVSGWEVAGAYIFQSGRPWDNPADPNVFILNDGRLPEVIRTDSMIRAVSPCTGRMDNAGVITMTPASIAAGCTAPNYVVQPSYSARTAPYRSETIRRPSFQQFDMNFAKVTRLAGRVRLQLRIEVFNVLNSAMYDERDYERNIESPNFGAINRDETNQSNFPRQIQLGLKLLF